MRQYIVAGLATALIAGGPIDSAPPASAGCQYGGPGVSTCDEPIQPDGTWQRCVGYYAAFMIGGKPLNLPRKSCYPMGPDQPPPPHSWADPPTHIDD
jgi:hypothetical protein